MPIITQEYRLGYDIISEHILQIAFWFCIISVVISIAILLEVTWLRYNKIHQEKYRNLFIQNWQPVLVLRALGEKVALPVLEKHDINRFLILWLHLQESLLGEPRAHLNTVMNEINLSGELYKRLFKGTLADRMIAITTHGYLRDEHVWNELEDLLHSPTSALSISAARALTSINPTKAAPIVFPVIAERRDWPAQKVARILKESPKVFTTSFLEYVEKAMHENQPYLIRLLRLLHVQHLNQSPSYIREILSYADKPELVLAALKLVREAKDLDLVRLLLRDGSWQVKVQAAKVLKRLGTKADIAALTSMLYSKNWWLRYRAASAINSMPFLSKNDFDEINTTLTDKYARDMFAYATASKEIL